MRQPLAFSVPEGPEQTTMYSQGGIARELGDRIDHTQYVNPQDLHQSSAASNSQPAIPSTSPTAVPTSLPTTQATGQSAQSSPNPPPRTTHNQDPQPARDAAGNMICGRGGCGSTTFPTRKDWQWVFPFMLSLLTPYQTTIFSYTTNSLPLGNT